MGIMRLWEIPVLIALVSNASNVKKISSSLQDLMIILDWR